MMALIVFVLGRGAVATAIHESRAKYAVAAWLQELAHFLPTFKGDGGPRQALERADALTIEYLTARRSHFRILMRQVIFALGMQAVSGSILLGVGGWLVMQGQITLGQLVAAELIVAVIVDTFAKLNKHAESFYDLLAAVDKIGHLFDLPLERLSGQALPPRSRGMALRVHRASYTFDDGTAGLRDANLEVAPGELVVIVGTPGIETSVLVDLLFHLRQAGSGYVCADDADLRTLSPISYRGQVALARHIELFTGTLAENVHLNRDGVDGHRVRAVLQAVGLWDEVLRLQQGTSTLVVPGGGLLSDCQARRLMLARALASRPRLLLIDRLLDALPVAALSLVMETLGQLKDECTIVIVSGRPEIFEAGRVCRLDGPAEGPSWADRPASIAAAMEAS
jgi:ABC-type bacteriocin/lantibiotic exporter with double-glycine peptidase domain